MGDYFDVLKTMLCFSQKNAERKAIVYNGFAITYSEFWNIVLSLTDELKKWGVMKGDYVAVYMSNSIEMVTSIFAILNCSAIVVPINIDLPSERILHIINVSNPKVILYNDHIVFGEFLKKNAYCID